MSAIEISHALKVISKVKNTETTFTFELEVPEDKKSLFHYKPGQFLTLFTIINGEAVNRSYSFSSCPILDKNLKLTIKRVPGGKCSNFLIDNIDVGDELQCSPPAGHFFNMKKSIHDNLEYYMFAAGSGVTPIYSIINWTLPNISTHKIKLFYSNKSPERTIFYNELQSLALKFPNLETEFLFSKVVPAQQRLSCEKILEIVQLTKLSDAPKVFYLCGPNEYMQMIEDVLIENGIDKDCIYKESFNITSNPLTLHKDASQNGIYIEQLPADITKEVCETIEAKIDGEWIESKGNSDESVLEVLLGEGHTPPFSCMSGSCMACLCKLVEGKVFMEDPGILTDEQLNENDFLSCQAIAITKSIKVAFEVE